MESRDKERVDAWLDGALKQYGEAEPRAGLEGRITANLQAASAHVTEKRNWWLVWVTVAASIAITGAIFIASGDKDAQKKAVAVQQSPVTEAKTPVAANTAPVVPVSTSSRPRRRQAMRVVRTSEPRRAQFPTPRPLTEQEQMLVSYVEEQPEEAKQVAQAQAELSRRDLAEFEKQFAPAAPSGSSQ